MASSLEKLLAEEGFKGSRRIIRSRSSLQTNTETMTHYFRDQEKRLSVSDQRIKRERIKSNVSQFWNKSEFLNRDTAQSRRPRDNLIEREKLDEALKNENEDKSSRNAEVNKESDIKTSEPMPRNDLVEVGEDEDNRVKDVYSNEAFNAKKGKEKHCNDFTNREICHGMLVKDAKLDKSHGSTSNKNMLGKFNGNTRKDIKHQERSYNKSNSKSFEDSYDKNHNLVMQTPVDLALDKVAVRAVVSILNGHIKRFLKDEEFRTTLRHNCFSALNFIELEDENSTETKVIRSLEQAIDTIDQTAEESVSEKELKRTSLQLSIITGLSLNDLKYGFTCGIPNYKLSACAHLYLGVVYKIQRKDKVSAKHILQVFCDSPSQARTTLLPELWEYLFSPHFSHLKAWYRREVETLADMPSRTRKLKHLEKVYIEHLDSGTYSFAVYYKDWLTDGAEAPSVPSISIPSISAMESQHGSSLGHSSEFATSIDSFSPQPMVSKKLYDSVFGSLSEAGLDEEEDNAVDDNLDNCMKHTYGSAIVKQKLTYVSEMVKFTDQDVEEDFKKTMPIFAFNSKGTSVIAEEEWREGSLSNDTGNSFITSVKSNMLDALLHNNAIELTHREVTGCVLERHDAKSFLNPIVSTVSLSGEESVSNSVVNPTKMSYPSKGLYFRSIPQEFICPLTGTLFEEPTTLETGQTFERAAIKVWFEKGNRTCPVSGNSLDCVAVPLTNLILKRLIGNWKSEQFRRLLDLTSQIVENSGSHVLKHDEAAVYNLDSLLSSLNEEDKTTYAKQLISLGLLSFLFKRFELGNLQEKTNVLVLLLNCIEADAGCIYQIARKIDKKCLLELLLSQEIAPRTNAISLLTELYSLKRRNDVFSILGGFTDADVFNTMNVLLLYLKNSPPHESPHVAVLLLHFDLLDKFSQKIEPRKYSIYREEAVNAIAVALDASLCDEKVREKCCRALLILEGLFSFTGIKLAKTSILKKTDDDNDCSELKASEHDGENLMSLEDEEEKIQEWLLNLLELLVGDGESPFLKNISRCLDSRHRDLVRVCLLTVTWLSSSLSILCTAGLHLPAFSAVIDQIKGILQNGELELKTLASLSLFNFSKISECRNLLMTIAGDIAAPLHGLVDVTWTAKQLLAAVSGEDL